MLTAKGRIATDTWRIRLSILTAGKPMPKCHPWKCSFPWSDPTPNTWFIGFTGVHTIPASRSVHLSLYMAHVYVQQTHTHLHRPRYICSSRPHLCSAFMRCSLIIIIIIILIIYVYYQRKYQENEKQRSRRQKRRACTRKYNADY